MQTFLPYSNFERSAKVLDRQRLGKQRVEAYQILLVLLDSSKKKKGWRNHPAVKMWEGYEGALFHYMQTMCSEWVGRGYRNDQMQINADMLWVGYGTKLLLTLTPPAWTKSRALLRSHRSNLLRKDAQHYRQFNWNVSSKLPYVWPPRKEHIDAVDARQVPQ